MTRYIAFVVFMLASIVATAQSRISVKEETYDDMETTAMVNPEKDRNNRDCALVIFHNVEPDGYYFDAGSVFIKAQNHISRETGEKTIFLYISEGAKVINLRHRDDGIMSLRYEFANGPLEGRHTYHVFLGKVVPANANAKQYLRFKITPPSASLEVEEQPGVFVPWAIDIASGIAAKLLPLGDYSYTVKAKQYHPTAGKVSMVDATQAYDEVVALKPAFGILEIAPINGATVFIDGENVADYKNLRLDPGEHTVKISRPKYKLYQKNVVITVGQTTVLNPDFEANFASVRLRASAPDVKISLREATSDRVIGTGEWTGDLDVGSYTVISSAPGHRESTHNFEIAAGSRNLTVDLPAPTPIYGSVNVSSSPLGARIKIDGKDSGSTPMLVGNILVGKHTIELSAPGKELYTASVDVRENEISELNATLKEHVATAPVNSNPVRDSSPAINNGGSYSAAGINDFSQLPDFVTHPMGYSGLWNFGDKKKTMKAIGNYLKGVDPTFNMPGSGNWNFAYDRHIPQKIAGYDFEFQFLDPDDDKNAFRIYYQYPDKSILNELIERLKGLNPNSIYVGNDFAIISNLGGGRVATIHPTIVGDHIAISVKYEFSSKYSAGDQYFKKSGNTLSGGNSSSSVQSPSGFNSLPAFITHPLGYNGVWNFGNYAQTEAALQNFFRSKDSTWKTSGSNWSYKYDRHYPQDIAGYNFEFYFYSTKNNEIKIYYKIADRNVLDALSRKLVPLNPEGASVNKTYTIINNLAGGHIMLNFFQESDKLSMCVEYTFSDNPNMPAANLSGGSNSGAGSVQTPSGFNSLPAFITHPLGYNGVWNFSNQGVTQNAVLDYFRGVDSSLTNYSNNFWRFYSNRSYPQTIAGYNFEFYFIYTDTNSFKIYYKTSDKSIFNGLKKALAPLTPDGNPSDMFTCAGSGGNVKINFFKESDKLSFCVEYVF